MRKIVFVTSLICIIVLWHNALLCAPRSSISITGEVRQPLTLTTEDLSRFESVSVRLNEVTSDKNYHGAFYYRGVPLKTLLELADIRKGKKDFFKPIDLVILVRSRNGEQVVLSWGEVFYRNPADIIIADSAAPVMPEKSCKNCHQPEVYKRWYGPLERKILFPKLVVANDFYTDRSLENISGIEVLDLHPGMAAIKQSRLFSPGFTITGMVKRRLYFEDLSSYPHKEIPVKQVGDGMGYHGMKDFEGPSLEALVNRAGIEPDLNTVFLVSAPDGYRSLLSYGELFLNLAGKNIILADKVSGKPIKEKGKFILIVPDDLAADRWVKAVQKIEAIQVKKKTTL
jgi:DMSO/TMAO reductase YedYZ molybdopterin-dependent catalytic subunit